MNPSWGWTAGSVISTADDLVVWAQAVVDGELLDPDMQARARGLVPANRSHPTRRLRLRLRHARAGGYGGYYGHAGLLGYNSQFLRNPRPTPRSSCSPA